MSPGEPMTPPPLLVRVDRARINRTFGMIMAMFAVGLVGTVAAGFWAAGASGSGIAGLPFAVVIFVLVFQIAFQAYTWGQRTALAVAMVVSNHGIWIAGPGHGSIALPWSAIADIGMRRLMGRRVLGITPAPGVGPTTPGVEAPDDARLWRLVHRRGLVLGFGGIDTDAATLTRAIAVLSGGRAAVAP